VGRRGDARPRPGRLRQPDHEQRGRRVGLFRGRGHFRRNPALHSGPGGRPRGLGHGPAPRLHDRGEHVLRRIRIRPRPRHVRRRHLRRQARPPTASSAATGPRLRRGGGGIYSVGGGQQERPRQRRLPRPARSAGTGSPPSMPTAAASSPCPAGRTTWPRWS
jgi:hypothetical protein